MVVSGKKKTTRYLVGDRFRGSAGEGTVTKVGKGIFPYQITWWNGRSEVYSADQIDRYGYQYLPPDPQVEDVEEEELGLWEQDFSREQNEGAIAPELTWKDWKRGDKVYSVKIGKHGVIEKLKFRPQVVCVLWDNSSRGSVEYSPVDLELLEIQLDTGEPVTPEIEDFSREQNHQGQGIDSEVLSLINSGIGDTTTLASRCSLSMLAIAPVLKSLETQGKIERKNYLWRPKKCSDNLTFVPASALDSPSQESKLGDLNLKDSAKSTATVEMSSPSDIQALSLLVTSSGRIGDTSEEESTLLQLPLLASLSPFKESDSPPTTQGTVSPTSSKRSLKSNRRTSRSKTSKACFHAHIDLEANSDTLEVSCPTFPSAGTMLSGWWSAADTLGRPSLESDCSWLESPSGLSSTGRAPGLNRLESRLVKDQALQTGEVINPVFLEDAFEIPLGWTDPLELRPATELLGGKEKRSVTALTPESPPLPSVESSTLTQFEKTEEELTPVDDPSVIGKHYWCDRLTVTVTIETLQNWRKTPRSPEIIRAARCRPWWRKDKWGNEFPDIMVLLLDELIEIEEFSFPLPERSLEQASHSLEKSLIPEIPISGISPDSCPECSRKLKSPDLGCGDCGWNMPLLPAPNPPFWKVGDRYRRRDRDGVCIIQVVDLKPGKLKIKADAIVRWFTHEELKGWADNLRRLPNGRALSTQSHSLGKPENHTTKQVGSLYQYTANKADKLGNVATYPKVEGDRSREEDAHWYWGFSYVEKSNGKWRDKSASVPRGKLAAVREALRAGKNYQYVLQQVLGKD